MFNSKSGLVRNSRLAYCAATIAAVGTCGSLAKEPNNLSASPEHTKKTRHHDRVPRPEIRDVVLGIPRINSRQRRGRFEAVYKKDENLQLGTVKLETIVYHFFQDKFFAGFAAYPGS